MSQCLAKWRKIFPFVLLLTTGCLGNELTAGGSEVDYLREKPAAWPENCTPVTQLTGRPAYPWIGGVIGATDSRRDLRNQASAWKADLLIEDSWTWVDGAVTATAFKCSAH